mgnify:CR=1 FL=1
MLGRDRRGASATAVRYRSRMHFHRLRGGGAVVASATVAFTALLALDHTPSPAAALPAGFSDTVVAAVTTPTAIEQLPTGAVVVLEQDTGRVRLIDPASRVQSSAPALDLAVCQGSERGLLGFTHDPDFGRTGRVYVFYTRVAPEFPGGCVNRVSAFTMTGATIEPESEQVLIDNISSVNGNHNAGDVEIGNDGRLYVSTGDAGRDPRGDSGSAGSNDAARDLSLLNGKILRLDRFTGAPAPGNPLAGPGTVRCGSRGNTPATPRTQCQEIFAWGLRNPYRFAFDPNTSATRFFVNDVGQAAFEEVNAGRSGADYGWNVREGTCPRGVTVTPCAGPPAGLVDPIVAYGRELGTYVTAGAFVPDGVWPERFDGGYLFADGGSGRIWLRNGTGAVDFSAPVAQVPAGLADMAFVLEPDGYALWGELMSTRATYLKAAGAILDGYVRDADGIEALGFPTFCRGVYAQDQGPRGKVIDYRCAIEIDGVRIEPGALLFGDREGVLVIPREAEEEAIRRAVEKAETENEVERAIKGGMSATQALETFGVM